MAALWWARGVGEGLNACVENSRMHSFNSAMKGHKGRQQSMKQEMGHQTPDLSESIQCLDLGLQSPEL